MEKAVGAAFYRNIMGEYGRVNQPKLIRDAAVKRRVPQMLGSVARGIERLDTVLKRIDPTTVQALPAKLQDSSLGPDCGHQNTAQHCARVRRTRRVKSTARNLNKAIQKFCMAEI